LWPVQRPGVKQPSQIRRGRVAPRHKRSSATIPSSEGLGFLARFACDGRLHADCSDLGTAICTRPVNRPLKKRGPVPQDASADDDALCRRLPGAPLKRARKPIPRTPPEASYGHLVS